jgi:CRISPR type III-B/RAMP module RAMP protein Cmr6
MAERYTIPRTRLPEGDLPPTLLFHRWQAYDRFENEGERKAFKRDSAGPKLLEEVCKRVQSACEKGYKNWYERFDAACAAVCAEQPPLRATTLWRLMVGWGTNPTFETGLTLDHFLGFPFIPGSAVKGLLHRVAEQELLESPGGAAALPKAPDSLPAEPPPELVEALARARRVRALFGLLHLRRQEGGPEAPFDRLAAWRALLPGPGQELESWTESRRQLVRLCSDAPAGGMVTCFDAVPAPKVFSEARDILKPDVLTPHKDNKPNPIPFLAVRDGVTFELRYRLAAWPSAEPRDHRDPEERERASDLGGIDRETVAAELKRWLVRGLAELGLGGKTSAGYGYLLAEGTWLPVPELLREPPLPDKPKKGMSEAERWLPDGIAEDRAVAALDKALREANPTVQAAVAARFKELFPGALERWRTSKRPATLKRLAALDRLLGRGRENEP